MTSSGPPGGSNPFEGLFGELAKLLSSQGPVNLEVARQMGGWIATGGESEPNPDPVERLRYEELVRVAELHVGEATGLATSVAGGMLALRPVSRGEWAGRAVDAYRPLFEGLATSLSTAGQGGEDPVGPDPTTELLGDVTQVIGPLLLGMQAGSMVGHLARRWFGQYDLPLPRPPSDDLVVVPVNVNAFAADWGLSLTDVRLWVCLEQVTYHAIVCRPHVRRRLDHLLEGYVAGFRPDPSTIEDRFAAVDPTDPSSLQAVFGDPGELLGAMQTPEQRQLLTRIDALVAAMVGYVDHVMDTVGQRLVGSHGPLDEALRRRRAEQGEGERSAASLLGVEVGPAQVERGTSFVAGVLERAGEEGLARLWRSRRELPTPAELDAPGLWLERIDLPDEP